MTPLAKRLRCARVTAELSQAQLSAKCGFSQALLSRFERGERIPDEQAILLLARALDIEPAALTHGRGAADHETSREAGGEEDDMRRRTLLAASVGIGSSAVLTSATHWDRALYSAPPASAPPPVHLNAGLGAVAAHLAATRYREAEQALPPLITGARALAAKGGRRGAEWLARAWALATAVRVKERHPDAWSTSSWAVEAAQRSQHPLAMAMAARAQFICLRQHGQHRQARLVADTAVAELADEELARPVVGHLLLEHAYGAAQAGRAADAADLWSQARELQQRGPATPVWPDHPGPLTREQVQRYGLCIHHTLGDTRRALAYAERLNAAAIDVPHTAARIWHDTAKLRRDVGDMSGALRLLENLALGAPQDARRTSVRTMVADMMQTSPALPGLKPLAASIGAL
ncbi:helix-turn-helix transcriptional regulator [Streptomyces sp. TRM70308]|uniref:helix-turn-helix domain-containing protein n=1 Tax=Streptomyces sp. TRM70308 TaxID=3131932 RepID=UPI003CFCE6A1